MLIMKNYTNMFIALLIFQLSSIRFPSIKKNLQKGKVCRFLPAKTRPFCKTKKQEGGRFLEPENEKKIKKRALIF